jgi:hypothetical protein
MPFFTTPRKSPRKAGLRTPSPSQIPIPSTNIKWEQEHEDELVQILKKIQAEGVLPPYRKHMAPEQWGHIQMVSHYAYVSHFLIYAN